MVLSIIHNCQKVEITQMSINWYVAKQNVINPYGIWFCYKTEVLIDATTWMNPENVTGKKLITKDSILYKSTSMKYP